MAKPAHKRRKQVRRLTRQIARLEQHQTKQMLALKRDVIHAVHHLLVEAQKASQ
jgi:hypothetical protein